jgi:type IX secretion system PorP/SprF family membrane protein
VRRVTILLIMIFTVEQLSGQHVPLYSEYMFNPVVLNPADAGYRTALDVSLVHRRQWTGFDGAPTTSAFNAHSALLDRKMNLGIALTNDRYGVTSLFQFKTFFAYRIFLSGKSHLSFGLTTGISRISNRWSSVNTTTGGDPVFTAGDDRYMSINFGSGIMYRTPDLSIGLALPALVSGKPQGKSAPLQFVLSGDYRIRIHQDFSLTPMLVIRHITNSPLQYDLNAALTYQERFTAGLGYRRNDALLFLSKFKVNDQFEAGYAYDFTITRLSKFSNGSHELLIRYLFYYRTGTRRPRV